MNIGELLIISLALAVDAASYAFAYGLVLRRHRTGAALMLALSVGFFQAFMPLMGYLGGVGVRQVVQSHGHWFVCGIFSLLGICIIRKAWQGGEESAEASPLGAMGLLVVGLATSIDAFAVGICMALGRVLGSELSTAQVLSAAAVIGLTTFAAALGSFHLSRLLHRLPDKALQTAAGLILIALGISELF